MAVIGVDIGTTSVKAVAYDEHGRTLGTGRAATPWHTDTQGVQMDAADLLGAARSALNTAAQAGGEPVRAVGVASMAESGILTDGRGTPVAPVIAWHDGRDHVEVAELADEIGAARFGERTGKPLRGQWSITKHRWLTRHRPEVRAARRRFNVAEWVVRDLGGDEVTELSLACRTGWFDLPARDWWSEGLTFSGADASLMPPLVAAGQPVGAITAGDLAGELTGAVLTVAGHDHQAAAAGVGANRAGVELDSCGTAEALVRTVEATLTPAQVLALAELGVTTDWSIRPGHWSLLGGTEGGLAMQRVLTMLGVDRAALAALDEQAAGAVPGRVSVRGLGTDALTIGGIADAIGPGDVWRATVHAATAHAHQLHEAMASIVGPSSELVVTGGWSHSAMFMAAKRAALGPLRTADIDEAGARGAALLAARAIGDLAPEEDFRLGPSGAVAGR